MSIIKWDDFNRLENFFDGFPLMGQPERMGCAIDVYEEDGKFVIEGSLPGFEKKDVSISVENGYLQISGKHEEVNEEEDKKKHYYNKEIRRGSFQRVIRLSDAVDADKIQAELKDGILKVVVPKKMIEHNEPKQIEIS